MWKKLLHALAPAAGAAVLAAIPVLGVPVVAKAAIGAFVAYLLKPARPPDADPPTDDR